MNFYSTVHLLSSAWAKSMERTGKTFGFVVFAVGCLILFAGVRKAVQYIRINVTQYKNVPGKIVDCIKVERQIKHGKQTDLYPVVEFEYEGMVHTVKSRVPFGAGTMAAFNEADIAGTLEIKVPRNDIEGAVPDYEINRGKKLTNALQVCGIGLAFVVAGLVFWLT